MRPAPLRALAVASLLVVAACQDQPVTAPQDALFAKKAVDSATAANARLVRYLAAQRGVGPLARPAKVRPQLVELGRDLLFDPILSGNRDVSCATCHFPDFATGDGRALSVGQGASGLGPARLHPASKFIPRNAPPLFNLGAQRALFWDGRVERDAMGRLRTPAAEQITPAMERVFEFGPVSALAMFPVTNRAEMRADDGNELAAIPDANMTAIWATLMQRLGAIPEYRARFEAAYPGTPFGEMTFAHASNAIAGFMVGELTFTDSPWDRFLAGDDRALTQRQLAGAQTFLTLKCSICHTGATFSDDDFHNVAVAQFGPGQGNGASGRDDFGRMNVTGDARDVYRFRTTPLRNVELTGPYGHTGAIDSLRDFIAHYSESDLRLRAFDGRHLEPALRGTLLSNAEDVIATRDTIIVGVVLTDELIDALTDYMTALTDERAKNLGKLTPTRVPSGLKVERP